MTTPWTTCVILYAQWSAGIRQTDFLRYPQQGGEMTGKALRQYRTKIVRYCPPFPVRMYGIISEEKETACG